MDLILNGQAQGQVASTLLSNGFDTGALRPWIGKDGRSYIMRIENGKPVTQLVGNVGATLRKEEWKQIDDAVVISARERLRVVADIRGAGLTYNIPNGMGKTVLVTQSMTDISGAHIDMDPAKTTEADRPEFDLVNLPLPVIHKDFYFNARQIATSRNSGTPIDVTTAQLAARRVSEEAEKLALGISPTYTYGGGTIYGLTNFPHRITKSLTSPEDSDWSPKVLIEEILQMRQASTDLFYYGPWVLYNSPAWDQYIDEDYSDLKGDNTVRDRIKKIEGISDVRTAQFLSGFQLVMVQMTSDVIRMVIGMEVQTLQWETLGGMRINFKVMAIMVPQLRSTTANINSNHTGIVHGVAS